MRTVPSRSMRTVQLPRVVNVLISRERSEKRVQRGGCGGRVAEAWRGVNLGLGEAFPVLVVEAVVAVVGVPLAWALIVEDA